MKNRAWPLLILTPLILLVLLLAAIHPAAAVTVTASNGLSCAGTRSATNLGCTAGEFTTIVNITNAPGAPTSCVAGEYIFYNGTVSLSGTNADRYDIGFFTGENGNDPGLNNASNFCSVATFPTTPLPWIAKDADACGDFSAAGVDNAAINSIKVLCAGDATGAMMIPYTLVYSQNVGIACTGPTNVVGGSTSKCNKGIAVVPVATFTVNGSVTVTKQTVPDIDPQSFAFTASGTGPVMTGDTSFNLTDNVSKQVRMGISGTNRTLTITETAADTNLWEPTATIACTLPDGITPAGFVATNGATRTITATLSNTNPNALCTLTNTRRTTTLATGTDPAAATIAPGAAATDVDLFTLQTSGGTETITSVTVNLSTSNGIGLLAITDNAGTVLGSTASPVTGSNTITLTTPISATTALTTFKVRVTPLSHAAMPASPGAAYAITAPVTAWAGPNIHTGSDTNTNALTIDNLSPAGATATSGSAGDANVTLSWTTSASTDFSRSVVLRWTGGSASTEVPAEGTDYANGNTIGTATVVCVRTTDAASTAVSGADGGGTGGCSATALTNGQAYTYKIFQKDSNGNYDTGVAGGTFTPAVTTATTTLATGTDPAAATIGPGAAATDVDLFTLQTSSGTEAITSVTVNLSTNSGVGRLAITNNAGTELGFTASPVPGSNTITVPGMSATTTLTTFKVRVTPLSHAAMPVPTGAAYAITAPVTAWAGPNTHAGSDTNPNALTIDNLSPNGATAVSGNAGDARMTLNWTTSSSSDFALTSGSVVYRWASASAGTEVPAEGSTPVLGSVNGTATIACLVDSSASTPLTRIDGTGGSADCTTAALTNGQPYTYKVFQKDSNGNYDTGVESVTLPLITKTNGISEINPGANTTYTVTISNNLGGTLQDMVFTDPAVTNLAVSNVSCTAAGGATCPATSVAAMQGAGISIPSASLPNNSSLTFTINATLSGGATVGSNLVNSARVTIGSRFVEATDTDLIVTAPSAAMSFTPSTITEGGASLLTITLTNYFSSAITGVAFTDTYPAGMVNTAPANGATTCGGTVTAANGGNSLALSGGTIPATGSCTVTVNVTSATAGSYLNSTGTVTHATGTIPAASATLTVTAAAGGSFVFTDAVCRDGVPIGPPPAPCDYQFKLPQVAGQDLTSVYITAVNASIVPTRLHASQQRTRDMEFGLSCHDPIANAGVRATFAGVTLPLCQASGAMPTTWSSPVTTVTFPGGSPSSSAYTFNYADVGRVELWMRNNATPTEIGNGGAFVVKPAGFVLSNIKCTTVDAANCGAGALAMPMPGDNPGAADAAGVTFIRAGHPFSVTVTATASGGAPTPNYGKETTPESVKLTSALVGGLGLTFNPNIGGAETTGGITSGSNSLVVASASGCAVGCTVQIKGAGPIGNDLWTTVTAISGTTLTLATAASTTVSGAVVNYTFGPFSGGSATGTAFTWNEVGIITLTPSVADANYLGAGDVIGTTSGNVGRFYAAKFSLSGGAIANRTGLTGCPAPAGCDTFTYMGEQMSALFTLTAQAVDGTTTLLNYNWSATPANQFAKLNPMAAVASGTGGPLGMGAVDSAATRTPFPPCGVTPVHPCLTPAQATAGTFASGEANVTVPLTIYRGNAAVGPYALLDIGVAPVDGDGAALTYNLDTVNVVAGTPNHTLVGQTQARYGRMKLSNAHGSELLNLPIPMEVQYWQGQYWVQNSLDDATTIDQNSINLATISGPAVTISGIIKDAAGKWRIVLIKPSAPASSNVCLDLDVGATGDMTCVAETTPLSMPYLQTGAAFDKDPVSRATFGVYKGNNEFIYIRENY